MAKIEIETTFEQTVKPKNCMSLREENDCTILTLRFLNLTPAQVATLAYLADTDNGEVVKVELKPA